MSDNLKQKILTRMEELGIQPKRSLGQNFLVNDQVVSRIIAAAEPQNFSKTFEIGPGLGALTDTLSERAQNFEVIELDKTFAQYWREQGLTVTEGDALAYPWNEVHWNQGPQLLVSNLPYQISSRIVVELSLLDQTFSRMVLMFQKEVAQRITAEPGSEDYGLLSVVAQCFWKPRKVVEAGAIDFMPKPNVASRVLAFESRHLLPADCDSTDFLSFLKLCFANRRKKLLPKLVSYQSKTVLANLFNQRGLDEGIRAEKLSCQDFIQLYLALKKEY